MDSLRFYLKLTRLDLGRLGRRWFLPAALAVLSCILAVMAGPLSENILSQGVSFSRITLAVTAPEGDATPELVARFAGQMTDVSRYCAIVSMEEEQALKALEAGEVTAVLSLPENFTQGISWGENPDVTLTVMPDRPLEALLLSWIGQSASELLAANQAGVYAVLELYSEDAGLSYDQVLLDINLRYINRTLNRQDLFRLRELSAGQALSIPLHYSLSLLSWLSLAAAPLYAGLYSRRHLAPRRRWRCVGRGQLPGYLGAVTASAVMGLPMVLLPLCAAAGGVTPALLAAALAWAVFCALFASMCSLVSTGAGGCGTVSFLLSLWFLLSGGGLLPPALLPGAVRRLVWLSPTAWFRTLCCLAMGLEAELPQMIAMLLAAAGMLALGAALYSRRADTAWGGGTE